MVSHDALLVVFFFFNDTVTTAIYTLSLHDALPIFLGHGARTSRSGLVERRPCCCAQRRRRVGGDGYRYCRVSGLRRLAQPSPIGDLGLGDCTASRWITSKRRQSSTPPVPDVRHFGLATKDDEPYVPSLRASCYPAVN